MKYKNQIVICILVFIVVFFVFYHTEEYQNVKPHYDCIITINVHEKIDFLLKQLANIKEYVGCNYAIILNCNDYMYEECNKIKSNNNVEHRRKELFHNVHINEEVINKSRNHGSLTHGIYSNMKYAFDHFTFDYFIVASSRNVFYNAMKLEDLHKVVEKGGYKNGPDNEVEIYNENTKNDWWWPNFASTLLGKYYIEKNQTLYGCAHEGLLFTYRGCNLIVSFFESNPEIKNDLFNHSGPVEEFALQTISVNSGEPFYYIGNGCYEEVDNPNYSNRIMKKIPRDGFIDKYMFMTVV